VIILIINNYMNRIILIIVMIWLILPTFCWAMPPGTILYRSSSEGKIYGYSDDPLIYSEKGIIKNIYSGHVAIYIGQENGENYIVEALADGIVKTPAKYFINSSQGEKFLGAKIPLGLSLIQRVKVVEIAKSLVGQKLGYDFDFKQQKGPNDGDWTCVGLVEKIYESANISNPYNLGALEYDPNYYAINITSDGFDNYSQINSQGDCFSSDYEFSKIARRTDLLLPAPELIGFDAGREYNGERYIFLPYTQFLQPTLEDVDVDIQISSDFSDESVRGKVFIPSLILRWSLINNPLSSLKRIAGGVKNLVQQVFDSNNNSEIVIDSQNTNSPVNSELIVKNQKEKFDSSGLDNKQTESLVKVNKKTISNESAKNDQSEVVIAAQDIILEEAKSSSTDKKSIELSDLYNPPEIKNNTSTLLEILDISLSSSIASTVASTVSSILPPVIILPSSSNNNENQSATEEIIEDWPKLAIIQQIYATGDNDWIRIYNPTDHDFDLAEAGYRLEKTKTAENPSLLMRIGNLNDGVYPGGTIIESQDSYLIVRDEASDYYRSQADAISSRTEFSWTGKDYTIYLGTGAISSSTDTDIIDALGFGEGATYFQGQGPALEITDNYILDRVDDSGNNNLDFSLIPSDDPSIEIIATSTVTATIATTTNEISTTTNTTTTSQNSYQPFTPIDSTGISYLWHFDECHGIGKYNVGKWDCAQEVSFNTDSWVVDLEPAMELNNFSLAFYYRKTLDNSRLDVQLKNPNDRTIRLLLENGRLQIEGLPNSQWRYYHDNFFTEEWHQIVLVINKNEGYWTIHLDGQEEIREEFIETLPSGFNKLIVTTDSYPVLFDEIVLWQRVLDSTEIAANYLLNVPFAPLESRSEPQSAQLAHFWNFNEGHILVDQPENLQAFDSIASSTIDLWPNTWAWRQSEDSALQVLWDKDVSVNFNPLSSKDLALTFWWRNSAYPKEGRIRVSLTAGDYGILSLVPTYLQPRFYFNHYDAIWSQSAADGTIPHDDFWHHLAITYDSYQYLLRLYVDGEEKRSFPYIWIADNEQPDGLLITSENCSSDIDDLGVWEGIMTTDKVREIYLNSQ